MHPPPAPGFLSKDFCLEPGLEWIFLLRRTCSDEKRPPPQLPELHFLKSETGRIRFRRARFQTPNSVSFSGLTEFRGASSVSSFQPLICVPKRTHRGFFFTHSPSFSQNSASSLFRNSTHETLFRLFPIKVFLLRIILSESGKSTDLGGKTIQQKKNRKVADRIFVTKFPSDFALNFPRFFFSRIFRALFPRKRRPQKIHQKSPPFFNAKSPGECEKIFTRFSGEQAKQKKTNFVATPFTAGCLSRTTLTAWAVLITMLQMVAPQHFRKHEPPCPKRGRQR